MTFKKSAVTKSNYRFNFVAEAASTQGIWLTNCLKRSKRFSLFRFSGDCDRSITLPLPERFKQHLSGNGKRLILFFRRIYIGARKSRLPLSRPRVAGYLKMDRSGMAAGESFGLLLKLRPIAGKHLRQKLFDRERERRRPRRCPRFLLILGERLNVTV